MTEKRYAKWLAYQQRCVARRRAAENGETAPETPSQPATSSAANERTAGSDRRSVRERTPTPRPREERRRVILRPNPEVVYYDPETAAQRVGDDRSPDRSPERSPSPGKGEQKGGKGKKGQKGKKGNSKGKKGGKGKQSGK